MNHSKTNKKTAKAAGDFAYLEAEDILLIHSAVIDETGGSHGVRDLGRVEAIIAHPKQIVFGKELLSGVFEKAASYGHDIIKYHPFVDGNKRSGMTSMGTFLELNDFMLSVKKGEIETMALSIVEKNMTTTEIALWLRDNSKQLKKR